ncbi:MAG TPA: helix-turn-helix domain-containing protein [Pseudomonadota bacterium]|nr:helix-turn-helix domain-containing protein [Pseudomonadota bacterium]
MGNVNSPIVQPIAHGITSATQATGIGRTTLYNLMQAGKLPYIKIGTPRLIPHEALVKLVAEGVK